MTHQVLKDEGEGLLGVNDIMKSDYVGVTQVPKQTDFSNGRTGSALFVFQADLLEGDQVLREEAPTLVHRRVGSLQRRGANH